MCKIFRYDTFFNGSPRKAFTKKRKNLRVKTILPRPSHKWAGGSEPPPFMGPIYGGSEPRTEASPHSPVRDRTGACRQPHPLLPYGTPTGAVRYPPSPHPSPPLRGGVAYLRGVAYLEGRKGEGASFISPRQYAGRGL